MSAEAALIGAVAGAGLWLLVMQARRGRGLGVAPWLVAGAGLGWVAAALFAGDPPSPPVDRPVELPEGDYVSSKTCRTCHPDQHATWHASYHRTMTQAASPNTVVPAFERQEREYAGRRLRWERRGDEFFVQVQDGAGGSRPAPPIERPIVQVTGSHHLQAFWYPTGKTRKLSLFPFCYHLEEREWLPVDAVFVMPPEVTQPMDQGRWNTTCFQCHATAPRPRVSGFDTMDTRTAELGIACEACHGPGREHVLQNRDPLRRYRLHLGDGADSTIQNPSRLPARLSAQVCGQCHGLTLPRAAHAAEWLRDGPSYRPGDELEETRVILAPDQVHTPEMAALVRSQPLFMASKYWSDGMVRVGGREYHGLAASPCFTHGREDETLTCLSCHAMHEAPGPGRDLSAWRDDQLRPGMRGNAACTQCHDGFRAEAALAAHTRHAPGSEGSNCYNCHMSHTSFGLLKATRSHAIDSPSVRAELDTGRPNACNQCHLDQTLGWTARHLAERYGIAEPELTEDQLSIAAGVLWALRGDAGQRALVAWSMGWEPAREASGTHWMAPYLAELMADPYHAIRFVSRRSVRRDVRLNDLDYDFMGPRDELLAAARRVLEGWSGGAAEARLLIGADGRLQRAVYERLLAARDHRPVFLTE